MPDWLKELIELIIYTYILHFAQYSEFVSAPQLGIRRQCFSAPIHVHGGYQQHSRNARDMHAIASHLRESSWRQARLIPRKCWYASHLGIV